MLHFAFDFASWALASAPLAVCIVLPAIHLLVTDGTTCRVSQCNALKQTQRAKARVLLFAVGMGYDYGAFSVTEATNKTATMEEEEILDIDAEQQQERGHSKWSVLCRYLRSNWRSLLLGQFLSILLATGGMTQSTLHIQCNLSAPTLSIGFVYLFLSLYLFSLRKYRDKEPLTSGNHDQTHVQISEQEQSEDETSEEMEPQYHNGGNTILQISPHPTHQFLGLPLHIPPRIYLIMAFLDVEANFLTVLAYRYTTLTSVSLFDALAIPSAMMLSRCLMQRAYGKAHLLGVTLCLIGVVVNVLQDYRINEDEQQHDNSSAPDQIDSQEYSNDLYPHRLRGDLLAVAGGILYGVNDVICEIAVRSMGFPNEFLGMIGLFAGFISIIQAAIVERDEITKFFALGSTLDEEDEIRSCSALVGWGLLFAFVLVNVISYAGAAFFLLLSEACFFNLSLLTGDLWTVLFSVTAQRIDPAPLFFVALSLIVGGVCVYEMVPSPAAPESGKIYERKEQRRHPGQTHDVEMMDRASHDLI